MIHKSKEEPTGGGGLRSALLLSDYQNLAERINALFWSVLQGKTLCSYEMNISSNLPTFCTVLLCTENLMEKLPGRSCKNGAPDEEKAVRQSAYGSARNTALNSQGRFIFYLSAVY
jgi:hypothetical protein